MMTLKDSGGPENGWLDFFAQHFERPTDALLAKTIPNVSIFQYSWYYTLYVIYVINRQINRSV